MLSIDRLIIYVIHYLLSADFTAVVNHISCSMILAPNFSCCFFIILIISKGKDHQIRVFSELFINELNLLRKIGKQMVSIQSRYFHLAFQPRFCDFPISRSSRQKMTTLTSREESKKTRWHSSKLDCEMRCEAASNMHCRLSSNR